MKRRHHQRQHHQRRHHHRRRRRHRFARTRAALALGLALLTTLTAAACGTPPEDERTAQGRFVFGYTADYSGSAALAVADEQGLWRKAGLRPQLRQFTNGPIQVQALGAGDLDFGYLGPGALWMSATGRAPIVSVNMLGKADRIVARPGSGMEKPADLKGKKIAVAQGTSGDMLLHLTLRRAGLSPSDVTKVTMDPGTAVSAFASGNIDAAATWYPLIDTMREQEPKLREISKSQDFYPKLTFPNVFVARPELPAEHPELVTKVARVLRQANDWIVRHPAASEKVAADFLDIPPADTKGSTRHVDLLTSRKLTELGRSGTLQHWFDGLADVFHGMNGLPGRKDPDDYYLRGLYEKAAGRAGGTTERRPTGDATSSPERERPQTGAGRERPHG